MTEREYDDLRNRIIADSRRKLEALELVWEMARVIGNNGPAAEAGADPPIPDDEPDGEDTNEDPQGGRAFERGELLQAVRDAVVHRTGEFSFREVYTFVRAANPGITLQRASIATALRRLVELEEIEIMIQGRGKRATVFRSARRRA
jgi:hypothetical protein